MTTKSLYASVPGSSVPTMAGGGVVAFAGRALALCAKHRRAQRDYERLLEMPESQLSDIGLTRSDVLRAKSEPMRLFDR